MRAFLYSLFLLFATTLTTTSTNAQTTATTIFESLTAQGLDQLTEYRKGLNPRIWLLQKGGIEKTKEVSEGGNFTATYLYLGEKKKFTGTWLWGVKANGREVAASLNPEAYTATKSSTGFMPVKKPKAATPSKEDNLSPLETEIDVQAALFTAALSITALSEQNADQQLRIEDLEEENRGQAEDILFLETLLLDHDSLIYLLLRQQAQAAQGKTSAQPKTFCSRAPRSGFIGAQYSQGMVKGMEGLGLAESADFETYGINVGGAFPIQGRVSVSAGLSGTVGKMVPRGAELQPGEKLTAQVIGATLGFNYEVAGRLYVGAGGEVRIAHWKYQYSDFNALNLTGSVVSVAPYAQLGYWGRGFGIWGRYDSDKTLSAGIAYHVPYKIKN